MGGGGLCGYRNGCGCTVLVQIGAESEAVFRSEIRGRGIEGSGRGIEGSGRGIEGSGRLSKEGEVVWVIRQAPGVRDVV